MEIFIKFAIFILLEYFVGAEGYCYMEDTKPYSLFGTKTSYNRVHGDLSLPNSNCEPVYIWALIRHGARYGERKDFSHLEDLKKQIIENHEATEKRGSLCVKDLNNLKQWSFRWREENDNQLTPLGSSETAGLAERLKAKLSKLFDKNNPVIYQFISSIKKRTKDSMDVFVEKIRKDGDSVVALTKDSLLHFITESEDWKKKVRDNADTKKEENEFIKSKYITQLITDVTNRLGFQDTLPLDSIKEMYKACAIENSIAAGATPAFCAAFTPTQLKIMEYLCSDLPTYYMYGYGSAVNKEMSNPILEDMVTRLTEATAPTHSKAEKEIGTFFIAHAETIIPTFVKMGLFSDTEHLKHDNYEKFQDTRKWTTSSFSSYSSNLIAVLYNCSNEYKVSLHANERTLDYPGCSDQLCTLTVLQEKFKKDLLKVEKTKGSGGASHAYTNGYTIFYLFILSMILIVYNV